MNKSAASPAPVAPTLSEQKADFTAEGSPPPGKVSTAQPVLPDARRKPAPQLPIRQASGSRRRTAARHP
jgi:hypothetical protein